MPRRVLLLLLAGCMLAGVPAGAAPLVWKEAKTDHFVVAYQNIAPDFVREVLRSAEAHYTQTMTTLGFTRYKGWTWDARVRIMIYDSRETYVAASHYGWSGGQVNPLSREIVTFPSESGFFDSLLPHEIGHIIFRDALGLNEDVPLWLEEGVAMYQEKGRRQGADQAVRALILGGEYIPLEALSRMSLDAGVGRKAVEAFYNEAASLVSFLINKGEVYRFARLCDEIKKSRGFPMALKNAYMQFADLEALEKAWRSYLNEARR